MAVSLGSLESGTQKLVSIGFMLGLGLIMLGKFQSVSGITSAANTAVGTIITGIDDLADWVGIIVLVLVFGYLIYTFKKAK